MSDTRGSGLFSDPALARFYGLGLGNRPDHDYCAHLAESAGTVLDLGCGTGDFCLRIGAFCDATGVDPADAMLDIARSQAGADRITWIAGDARSFSLDRKFDLIVLTGHSFQVFLTDEDQAAVLATVARHLAPGGRFVFDTRNPDFPGSKERTRAQTEHRLMHPELGPVDAWNHSEYDADAGILTYSNTYSPVSGVQVSTAVERIRYISQDHLAALITDAGLRVDRWLGDWTGGTFHARSREIIPVGGLA